MPYKIAYIITRFKEQYLSNDYLLGEYVSEYTNSAAECVCVKHSRPQLF